MAARVAARTREEAMPTLDIDEIPHAPPMKKMRGRVTNNVEKMMASGRIPAGIRKPELRAPVPGSESVGKGSQSWAMVPYRPPIFPGISSTDARTRPQPRPIAIRDCPPGMRIRGGRPMPVAVPKPAAKRPEKRKIDPVVTISSDSESEQEKHRFPSRHSGQFHGASSSRPAKKEKVGSVWPLRAISKERKHKATKLGDTVVKFEPTASELGSSDPRKRVKYILRQFDNLRRRFLADEPGDNAGAGAKRADSQKVSKRADDQKANKRADLKASNVLMGGGYRVNGSESICGEVPGVEVGDHYYYRMELLLISLHRQSQAGIDYIPASKSQFRDNEGRSISIAVSVIASGGYEDDKDEGDTLMYTGQGGNNYKGDKRQGLDQKMLRGNLALKNCCDLGLSVRVIRGCEFKKSPVHQSPSGRIYYYDGMYDVVDCFQEKGSSGFKIWKFKLVRKPGQKALSSHLVLFKGKSLPAVLKSRGEKILSDDISQGLEPSKVRLVGGLDDDRGPDSFQYITRLRFAPGLPNPSPPAPCISHKQCSQRYACGCVALNGTQPYNDEGGLLRAKRLVYECGPLCPCAPGGKCTNRVSQKGLRYDMEVFKTKGKGWGVRSSNFIPQGSFVCEYIGEIIHESDAEKRVSKDEYMFDLKIPDSMERRFGDISGLVRPNGGSGELLDDDDDDDDANCDKYTVDANRYGNLGRFVNHSCEPNLFVQCVLYDHHDHRFPHIMLFASEHIAPYKELTYDYGYELNKIKVNGKVKVKNCYCGARTCQGRLY